jgi:hypothetical protein
MDPFNPGALPDGLDPNAPKPWEKQPPQPQPPVDPGSGSADLSGAGDAVDLGLNAVSLGADIVSGAADLAIGAVELAGEAAGGILEGAGSALEGASGCADGCGGCSLAVLALLFVTASSAMALFR